MRLIRLSWALAGTGTLASGYVLCTHGVLLALLSMGATVCISTLPCAGLLKVAHLD
jgi:hypothetical protein